MADPRAVVLARAVHYAGESNVDSLAELAALHQSWLSLDIVLRLLLTYLPESLDPSHYTPFLRTLAAWNADPAHQALGDAPSLADNEEQAPQHLHLFRLKKWDSVLSANDDVFQDFLVDRAHRIDDETGALGYVHDLIEPFADRSPALKTWFGSTILPLVRLDYEYYPDMPPTYSLQSFERLGGRSGVYALLFELLRRNKDEDSNNYGRDFPDVLAPWIQGEAQRMDAQRARSTTNGNGNEEQTIEDTSFSRLWSDVLGTLLDHAVEYPASMLSLSQNWDGPHESALELDAEDIPSLDPTFADEKYTQFVLALLYLTQNGAGVLSTEQESLVLRRAAEFVETQLLVDPKAINLDATAQDAFEDLTQDVSPTFLHSDELLEPGNPFTDASPSAVQLGAFLATSRSLMASLEDPLTMQMTASLCLFGHAADQRSRMQKILNGLAAHSATGDSFWRDARKKLLWLRRWNAADGKGTQRSGLFGQIELLEMEVSILKTLARTGRFKLLSELYVQTEDNVPRKLVEQVLAETALTAYDNASNGNKTRGGMKTASDIIATFRHQFPDSTRFQRAHALIQATHALSFYSLTLQHGTPFLPVNLRAHPNPVGLFDKLLEQNPQSYTKLDDLIEIGKNFVRAGLDLPHVNEPSAQDAKERALTQIERTVVARAINAALAEGDFDTAYSYVVNRLSTPRSAAPGSSDPDQGENLLWRAAYEAGRHQSSSTDGPSKLRRIEQRMELLSQAVLLAPPSALQDVLETWNACETEFNACRAEAAEEEEQWNSRGDATLPGGFTADSLPLPQKARESTRRAMQEEAPMGLFDVARGAAAAFSKSAFAPGAAGRGAGSPRQAQHFESEQDAQARVRKRDMVSSAVTGGLVSGLGWVLGAKPTDEE